MFARISRRAGSGLASAVLVAGLGAFALPATSAASKALTPLQAVQRALQHYHIGGPNQGVGPGVTVDGQTAVTSTNWSGYADTFSAGKKYSAIRANWKQPAVTCASTSDQEIAATWVGIDGLTAADPTVEQDGTLAFCDSGSISYFDWWEMFPTNAVQVVAQVSAGSSFTSSVVFTNGKYKLTVTDHSNASGSFTTTQACGSTPCNRESAEWIAERPSGANGLFVLPNFGRWTPTTASVTSGGAKGAISSFPDESITMDNASNQTLVSVSALNATGKSFTARWSRAS